MKIRQAALTVTATDLANHLSCRHLTALDLRLAKGEIAEPVWQNPHLRVLQQRGLEHERAYVESLRARGLTIADLSKEPEETAAGATRRAMEANADAIVQAALVDGNWRGRADVLLRVDRPEQPSRFGDWSYEAVDCKLALETKGETILQLCLYSDLVSQLQGVDAECFHVIRPRSGFVPESYRVSAFAAYYRAVKQSLDAAVNAPEETYPEPVAHCDICRWWKECDTRRRQDDHLSFVAGASRLQRKELANEDIVTLESLANLTLPISFRPSRGAIEGYTRIREQARVQFEARTEGRLKFEMLQTAPGEGLLRLPPPSPGDIFLDFEGDPFVDEGGLEYLFGVITAEDGELRYEGRWALDRAGERATFEWFIDLTFARLARFADLHIYHFGSYETGAIKRLMLRYATREEEVDRLLRGHVFVDLHTITKQTVRASVEQYSLKEIEKLCDYRRRVLLPDANQARHFIEHQLELSRTAALADEACAIVAGYNEDDCRATERLRGWLEELRAQSIREGADLPRPPVKDAAPKEAANAHRQRVAALFDTLTCGLPEPADRTTEQSARWLLAHALDWHYREEKVKWWEFFRMKDLSEEELYDEKTAIAGLSYSRPMPKMSARGRAPIDQYRYPAQNCSVRVNDTLHTLDEQTFGEVVAADPDACTIDVKKQIKLDGFHPTAVFAYNVYSSDQQSRSILRIADWIAAHGMDGPGDYRAARDLLLRNAPRIGPAQSLARNQNETMVETACRIALALDHSVLPIQGPPGAGKTYTGARMICELVKHGHKVGITAVGHKVIRGLLEEVGRAAVEMNVPGVRCAHKNDEDDGAGGSIREIRTNDEALRVLESGEVNVLGGTSWLWSREELRDSVHVLFVDEAGQMSLANALACAPAANSLVLIGDPQQLEQPQKGSHPEGSDISALAHLLGGRTTIAETQGLFLAETRRLHPAICRFCSELFYEGRLHSVPGLERQTIQAPPFSGAHLWFIPVIHHGNQSHSTEEIDRVAVLVETLTREGTTWIDGDGEEQPLTRGDLLIVAPYNDQVNRLTQRLPDVKVGTVDKFQGQEAAIVIYSMTTSTPEDAPRGMEFLYDPHRINVATSRARCACIVVASPALLSPECHTPRQMELANVMCRYAELSQTPGFAAEAGSTI